MSSSSSMWSSKSSSVHFPDSWSVEEDVAEFWYELVGCVCKRFGAVREVKYLLKKYLLPKEQTPWTKKKDVEFIIVHLGLVLVAMAYGMEDSSSKGIAWHSPPAALLEVGRVALVVSTDKLLPPLVKEDIISIEKALVMFEKDFRGQLNKRCNIVKAYTSDEMFNLSFNAVDEDMTLSVIDAKSGSSVARVKRNLTFIGTTPSSVNKPSEATGKLSIENIRGKLHSQNATVESLSKKN
ncbi:hypothetical protein ACH5RR_029736 [Cinchona calisaya]|uniref:Uncharacterized protein n=1 Tax=Cinchona calisaya TaxID=153742 RepID=A0ABD2YSH3_9GENT